MIISTIMSQARKLVNDNDATNPFHSDAELYEFVTDWLHDAAMEMGFPHKQQAITVQAADGGDAGGETLDNDWLEIILATWEPTTGSHKHLTPRTEAEMDSENANWRDLGAAPPTYYIIQDAVTAQTNALGPARTITTDCPIDQAGVLRLYGLQQPAVISAGTNSPIFPVQLHKSAVYYLAGHMLLPRDEKTAQMFLGMYEKRIRRCKTLMRQSNDSADMIWDRQEGNASEDASRLSRG